MESPVATTKKHGATDPPAQVSPDKKPRVLSFSAEKKQPAREPNVCSICLEPTGLGECRHVGVTSCGHLLHEDCWGAMLVRVYWAQDYPHLHCPQCNEPHPSFTPKVCYNAPYDEEQYDTLHDFLEDLVRKSLWSNNVDIVQQALARLKDLPVSPAIGDKDNQMHLVDQLGAHVAVLRAMERFPNDPALLTKGCSIVQSLFSKCMVVEHRLVDTGAGVIIQALKTNDVQDGVLQTQGLGALNNMCYGAKVVKDQKKALHKKLIDDGVVALIDKVMSKLADRMDKQQKTLLRSTIGILHFMYDGDHFSSLLKTSKFLQELADSQFAVVSVLDAMKSFPLDEHVAQKGCDLVREIAGVSESHREKLVGLQAVEIVKTCIDKSGAASFQEVNYILRSALESLITRRVAAEGGLYKTEAVSQEWTDLVEDLRKAEDAEREERRKKYESKLPPPSACEVQLGVDDLSWEEMIEQYGFKETTEQEDERKPSPVGGEQMGTTESKTEGGD